MMIWQRGVEHGTKQPDERAFHAIEPLLRHWNDEHLREHLIGEVAP